MKLYCILIVCIALPTGVFAKIGSDKRPVTDMIVLHAFGGYGCQNDKWTHFKAPKNVSAAKKYLDSDKAAGGAHYIVGKDGTVLESTPLQNKAAHVYGRANVSDTYRYNERSIGIELLNDGDNKDKYPEKQMDALVTLLKNLVEEYEISKKNIVRHSDLDKRKTNCGGKSYPRRIDPGILFPYDKVLNRVYK